MSFKKSIAAVALVAGAFAASTSLAEEPANTTGCLHLSKQVTGALNANQQSPNYKAASDEQSLGRQYCMNGLYSLGVAHYEKALSDLGQQQSKS